MSTRLKVIIGILIFVVISSVVVISSILSDRVELNPEDTIGNTAGNATNGGYFCELDGRVYFSNPEDHHTLYSMKPDETDMKRHGSMGVSHLLGAGRYLYLYMDSMQYSTGKGLGYMGGI